MKNDTMISIRVNKETKEKASLVAQSAGMSLSGVFKALMIQMAEKKIIPFEIQSTISNVSVLHPASWSLRLPVHMNRYGHSGVRSPLSACQAPDSYNRAVQ